VLHGSTREGRFGISLAKAVVEAVNKAGHKATLFDAAELKLPMLTKPFHHYKEGEVVPDYLKELEPRINAQDAFIVVDGEYNYTPTPGMLNLLDHFYHKQYRFKAAGIANYGASAGGARSAYVLRNTLSELGMVVAPATFNLSNIWTHIDFANSNALKPLDEAGQGALTKFLTEFLFLADTLKTARPSITFKLA